MNGNHGLGKDGGGKKVEVLRATGHHQLVGDAFAFVEFFDPAAELRVAVGVGQVFDAFGGGEPAE